MHILYLDESGGPNSWNVQRNFVLGGVAIHEGQIYSLTKELNDLQEKYFPGIRIPIEFHVTPIRDGRGPHFNKFSRETREQMIDDVYHIMQKSHFPNLIAFATSLDISAVDNPTQVCRDCFEDVCQHFNLFLYNQYRKGIMSKGLLIIDRGREKQYLHHFGEFKKSEKVETYLGNIVDIPYFAACRETRMLQLADFCANAVFRYFESGITYEFEKIVHLFYRGIPQFPVQGLYHITNNETCDCCVCS